MHFALYDVFCEKAFSGNPAAVVRSMRPMSRGMLLKLAQEFNQPETCLYRMVRGVPCIRFATSGGSISACGHGLLATLADVVLVSRSRAADGMRYVVEGQGVSGWRFVKEGPRAISIAARWPRTPILHRRLPPAETATILGIRRSDIVDDLPLAAYDCGIVNGLVPVADERTLKGIQPDFGPDMLRFFERHKLADLEPYVLMKGRNGREVNASVRARNVFPYGVREEAATGSAAVSLAYALSQEAGAGEYRCLVTQGLSRQGRILVRVVKPSCGREETWLEGRVVMIGSGDNLATS
jgi:PhzF family phenazine biosynthesis protein